MYEASANFHNAVASGNHQLPLLTEDLEDSLLLFRFGNARVSLCDTGHSPQPLSEKTKGRDGSLPLAESVLISRPVLS